MAPKKKQVEPQVISDIRRPFRTDSAEKPKASEDFLAPRIEARIQPRQTSRRPMFKLFLGAALCVAGIFLYIWWASRLTVQITPKRTSFSIDSGVTIVFPAKDYSSSLVQQGEGESRVSKKFSEKARGDVVIYNNYGSQPQVLVAGTRLESPEGLIFKTAERITVPGMVGGKTSSATVAVIASEAGEKYNVGLSDFVIPGFKGTPKYEKFYGRSKIAIKGGSEGEGKVVGKEEAEELLAKLEEEVLGDLKKNLRDSIPRESVVFPEKFDYKTTLRVTDPPVDSPGEKFFGEVRGEVRTLGIDANTYRETLAVAFFKDTYQKEVYALDKSSDLTFSNIIFDYEAKTVTANIAGRIIFIGNINEEDIRQKILGSSGYDDLGNIFKSYPAILRVEASFWPSFWKHVPRRGRQLIVEIS